MQPVGGQRRLRSAARREPAELFLGRRGDRFRAAPVGRLGPEAETLDLRPEVGRLQVPVDLRRDARVAAALASLLGPDLARDLAADLVKLRLDLATRTLERAAPGKFVETFVQCLQYMATGKHDAKR